MGDKGLNLGDNAYCVYEVSKQGEKLALDVAVGKEVVGDEQGGT